MLTKFWESLGEGLSEKWLGLFGPSLVFWIGGAFFAIGWDGIGNLSNKILTLPVTQQAILLVGAFLLVLGSASFLQQLSFPILRALEGYWLFPFVWLRLLLIRWQSFLINRRELQWQSLAQKPSNTNRSPSEAIRFGELDRKLHYVPSDPFDYMPTALGNILRMAETQPRHKYGLDGVVCWPRLWPLLSDHLREEIAQSRQSLNQGVELWTWGVLFMLWGFYAWWAIPLGLIWAWIAYGISLNAAMVYADLVEVAFDTQRWDLYKALHFKLPNGVANEMVLGEQITEYLWRATLPDKFKFTHPKS